MLTKFKRFYNKKPLKIFLLFLFSFLFLISYINYKSNIEERERIKSHACFIKLKIDNYKLVNNEAVDNYVINIYKISYQLAQDGEKSYYMFENMADGIVQVYWEGYKDGKKKMFLNNYF